MSKAEFLEQLEKQLFMCPRSEVEKALSWYSEMIDDRLEEKRSEAAAAGKTCDAADVTALEVEIINSLGNINDIANGIKTDIPISKLVKEKVKNRRSMSGAGFALIIITCPLWLCFLFGLLTMIFSLYIVIWALEFSFLITAFAAGIASIATLIASIVMFINGEPAEAILNLGTSLCGMGLSMILWMTAPYMIKGTAFLSKKIYNGIKLMITGRKELG